MKRCTTCQQMKPAEAFGIRRASPDGLSYKCRECASMQAKARYAANSAPAKARAKAWALANPERRRAISRAYDDRNSVRHRETSRAYQRRFRAENPGLYTARNRASAHIRRSRESGRMDAAYVADLLARAGGVCVYCLTPAPLTVDHMIAVGRGGDHGNDNLAPCCKSCNSSKNADPIDDWLMRRHGVVGVARAIAFLEGNPAWREIR